MRHWCTRCGVHYVTATHPACECAGDLPIGWDRKILPNFHPDRIAYNRRVRELRHDEPGVKA